MLAFAAAAGLATMPASGASSAAVVVQATIASATEMDTDGCAPAATSFGSVLPGAIAAPNVDCVVTFGSSNSTSMLHAYQGDGLGSAMFRMTDGKLDTGWDGAAAGNGQFTIPGDLQLDWDLNKPGVALQPTTGKVVAAYRRTSDDVNVVRLDEDGTLDATFGTAGRFASTSGDWGYVNGLTPAADGSLFVLGRSRAPVVRPYLLAKLTPSGALDTTFDGASGTSNGIVELDFGATQNRYPSELLILADGDLFITGYRGDPTYPRGFALRVDPQGRPDTAFGGGDGYVEFDLGGHTYVNDAVEQPDGRIVVAGSEWMGDTDFVLGRLMADGTLDASFDGPAGAGDGLFMMSGPAGTADGAMAVALLPDGDILAVGTTSGSGIDVYSMRVNGSSGTLDLGWDGPSGTGDGKVQLTLSAGADGATDIIIGPDGGIYVAGTTTVGGFGTEPVLMKWRDDGTLDPAFDGDGGAGNGSVRVTATSGGDDVYRMALAADGDIVFAGTTDAATDLLRTTRFDGLALLDYDDDDVATDNNWTQGSGFFGVCLRAFTGTSAASSWTANATCPQDETSNYWRPVGVRGASAKVGQIAAGATDGSAHFRFALRAPTAQQPGVYTAPVTFEVIAPAS